ncbi:MAG TPA: hypothetical protein VGJ84_13140, partial [Polyangiaceae bacterium]
MTYWRRQLWVWAVLSTLIWGCSASGGPVERGGGAGSGNIGGGGSGGQAISCILDTDCPSTAHCSLLGVCSADCVYGDTRCGAGMVCTARGRCVASLGGGGSSSGGTGTGGSSTGGAGTASGGVPQINIDAGA